MSFSVSRRFCGPDESANGGWFSGRLAEEAGITGPASVRLLSPPPLEREIQLLPDGGARPGSAAHPGNEAGPDGGSYVAMAGDLSIARVAPGGPLSFDELPEPVSFGRAEAAGPQYPGLQEHPFDHCFSCGTRRDPSDALCLRPGPIAAGMCATAWRPREVTVPIVWSALDCPGGWALGVGGRPMVLGTITGQIHRMPQPGEELVVMAWAISSQGRKHTAGTALYAGTEVLAQARSVWIAVDHATIRPA